MSIFNWIGSLFKPAADLVDDLVYSGEERGNIEVKKQEIKAKIAEIEAKVATRVLDLQNAALEANAKVAMSEQQHGNTFSKIWRPIASLCMVSILMLTGFGVIEYKELLVQISGGFLGIYGIGRSYEKGKK
jgi:hypothetical protein